MALHNEVKRSKEIPVTYGKPNEMSADLKKAMLDLTPEQAEYVLKMIHRLTHDGRL